jgi:hypothetical protein
MNMSVEEFLGHVREVASECGYDVNRDGHPEDFAMSLVTVMQAWAAGYGIGYRRGLGK